MKAICTTSHEVSHGDGKFTRFEAGQEYDLPEVGKYFQDIESRVPRRKAAVKTDEIKIEDEGGLKDELN
jgi:hypothetical protein